jgi:hypothetical protein
MTRLLILVEGQSEEIFVKQTLTPYLADYGVYVQQPALIWTKRMPDGGGFRGGVSNWNQIYKNLRPLINDSNAWVTTLLDFYGLPDDFPSYLELLNSSATPKNKVIQLQESFATAVKNPTRFIPFLALHEFEAWLFSSPEIIAEHFGNSLIAAKIQKAIEFAGEPELINHGTDTHPKARLKALNVGYKETSDGATLIQKIGIANIKAACPHFALWLNQLEKLGEV